MDEGKKIEVLFVTDEIQLYELAVERCRQKNTGMSEYVKDLIKVDLAWGRFARRKKEK